MENYDLDIEKAPNTKQFLDDLILFIDELNKPNFKKLRKENKFNEIEELLERKYKRLFELNYSLVFAVIRNEITNFDILVKMINVMILLETKQISNSEANNIIKDLINDLYIYPKFGGKENFEKIIKSKHEK